VLFNTLQLDNSCWISCFDFDIFWDVNEHVNCHTPLAGCGKETAPDKDESFVFTSPTVLDWLLILVTGWVTLRCPRDIWVNFSAF